MSMPFHLLLWTLWTKWTSWRSLFLRTAVIGNSRAFKLRGWLTTSRFVFATATSKNAAVLTTKWYKRLARVCKILQRAVKPLPLLAKPNLNLPMSPVRASRNSASTTKIFFANAICPCGLARILVAQNWSRRVRNRPMMLRSGLARFALSLLRPSSPSRPPTPRFPLTAPWPLLPLPVAFSIAKYLRSKKTSSPKAALPNASTACARKTEAFGDKREGGRPIINDWYC